MPLEEQAHGSRRVPKPSPSRAPARAGSRLYSLTPQASSLSRRQQRAALPSRKPPEPLRRAVADCLSAVASNLHSTAPVPSSEASRALRDYIANPSTTDMAYSILLEHTLAERERSPAVVSRCVAILKRYLLRYIPKVQTLRQIDLFCENSMVECESLNHPRGSSRSKSLGQQPRTSPAVNNSSLTSHVSTAAPLSLVKSLIYVRSLVARHIPKLSFQSMGLSGVSASTKQSLPILSSLLTRSLTSHLCPEAVNSSRESPQRKEGSAQSPLSVSNLGITDEEDRNRTISFDLLTWRWSGDKELQPSSSTRESDGVIRSQDVRMHGFLEVGAAALLIGDIESKSKDQAWKYSVTHDLPVIDQLLKPSTSTAASNIASPHKHLKAITTSKRLKPSPEQLWANLPVSTYHPRARPLFQYRHYSEQQPLRLNPAEISEVIAEVCSESSSPNVNLLSTMCPLTKSSRRPSTDVAVSVLIKLVIDMYMMDSGTAAPLTLSMLENMLASQKVASRTRVFDIILNLGVHAHLLEPVMYEDSPTIEEDEAPQEPSLSGADLQTMDQIVAEKKMQQRASPSIDKFESWILVILFRILRFLVQAEEQEEIVWASALSCLFYFVCDRGKILRSRLEGLDIRVIKTLLEMSRKHSWAEIVHCRLICMLTNMFYQAPDGSAEAVFDSPIFLSEQVDLLGGIDFICIEYSQANSREEQRNLFLVLLDFVLDQINGANLAAGVSAYVYDEIQLVASMLSLADAPEAFYIAVKHGVEGIGEILRRPISAAMSHSPNYERLDLLLDKITRKLDATICTFTRLDDEFSDMIQITKSYRSFNCIEDGLGGTDIRMKVGLSWATLHSLVHSERSSYHHNGYIWLTELLLSEIHDYRDGTIWENIGKLQQQIVVAGSQDLNSSSVPLSISILCGLLKSKHNNIRWGFLFVMEKLLMRLKLLLDESETDNTYHVDAMNYDHSEIRLEKANAVVDIMSCALSLVVQINETDRINILKMCDILFSQLCLRIHCPKRIPPGDFLCSSHHFGNTNESCGGDIATHVLQPLQEMKNFYKDDLPGKPSNTSSTSQSDVGSETSSMAALLLQGHATVPMQLVARVPTSLFYWPLIQLAGAATDDIALGVAVGSKGGGNLPGSTSDIRAALLLLLIGKCTADSTAFLEVEGEEFFRGLLDDTDSRVAYYTSAFLLKRMMTEEPEDYQRMLQNLIIKAQQSNNEKLLENPYLQMRGILQLSNDPGA